MKFKVETASYSYNEKEIGKLREIGFVLRERRYNSRFGSNVNEYTRYEKVDEIVEVEIGTLEEFMEWVEKYGSKQNGIVLRGNTIIIYDSWIE